MIRTVVAFGVLFVALPLAGTALAQAGSESIELTVYNQGIGLVKDTRTLELAEGRQSILFSDVASQIDPTSVHFRALGDGASVEILEQNYQFDLVDRARLLEKYLGKEITLVRYDQDGNVVARDRAVLLAADGGSVAVARVGDQIVLSPRGTVELPDLPEGLMVRPTLVWDLDSAVSGPTPCEVSYMTQGISWTADYVLVVNENTTGGALNGWVTLTNASGATYRDAKLKLIAGDVAVAREPVPMALGYEAERAMGAPQFEEKAFFEYHMYSLPRPTTVRDRETKQVLLLSSPSVTLKKRFIFEPSTAWRYGGEAPDKKIAVKVEVKNSEDQGLGLALPKGRVRVFQADPDGSLQFAGEDSIDHTPRDETIRLYVGNAFDLVGEETPTAHRQVSDRVQRDSFSVKLRNRKEEETVEITYVAHFSGDWEILAESDPHVKKDAYTAEWTVSVEPGEEREITYTVERRW